MQSAKRKRTETGELDSSSALLETLVNQTVIAVERDPRAGTYSLHFADGRTAVFEGTFAMEGGEGASGSL